MSSKRSAARKQVVPAIPKAEDPPVPLYDDTSDEEEAAPWSYRGNFAYIEPEGRGPRGFGKRKEYHDLFNVVSSKNNRDIVRRNEFMSQAAFDAWNAKQKNKCWAGLQDYDGDQIATEFVVRRTDERGPVIAVNGYTTKASDWDTRRHYYNKYPSYASRKKKNRDEETYGPYQSYQDFIDEHYGYEEDDYGFATDGFLEKRKKAMEASPYNLRIKNPTPYNIFQKRLIGEAFKTVITGIAEHTGTPEETLRSKCTKSYNTGWLMKDASKFWDMWVKRPIIDSLSQAGHYAKYLQAFVTKKQHDNMRYQYTGSEEQEKEFHTWLFSKKEIKAALKEYVKPLFNMSGQEYFDAMDYLMNHFTAAVNRANGSSSPPPKRRQGPMGAI